MRIFFFTTLYIHFLCGAQAHCLVKENKREVGCSVSDWGFINCLCFLFKLQMCHQIFFINIHAHHMSGNQLTWKPIRNRGIATWLNHLKKKGWHGHDKACDGHMKHWIFVLVVRHAHFYHDKAIRKPNTYMNSGFSSAFLYLVLYKEGYVWTLQTSSTTRERKKV